MGDHINNTKKVIQSIKYLIDKSSVQFEIVAYKIPDAQAGRIKNLLWISSALIIGKFHILSTSIDIKQIQSISFEYLAFCTTFFVSIFTFAFTAFAFRSNRHTSVPYGNPYYIMNRIINFDENEDYISFYYDMVSHIHNGLDSCYSHITETGRKIRIITSLIVFDIVSSSFMYICALYSIENKFIIGVYACITCLACYVSTEND